VLTVIAGLAVVAAGGCATVPASGQPRLIKVSPNSVAQGEEFPQLIPAPPGNHWTPNQIVSGFLVASAGFADTVAREYLGPGAQNWKPGWAVTVVSQPIVKQPLYLPHLTGQLPGKTATVEVSGQELATLTASGQYQVPPASTQQKIRFSLKKVRGQWRITNPPQRLILSKADFLRVYQPRNLYFFTLSGGTLVPDPVFVPLQATTTDLAGGLVNALKQRPLGYLQGVTQTKFPPDTRVLGVRIAGSGATVNLGGSIARATPVVLASVTAQIVWTLTSPSYGRSAISSVRLEINGRPPQGLPGSAGGAELLGTYARLVPEPSVGAGLFFVGSNGAVELLSAAQGATAAVAAHGQAGTGLVPMKAIAVSPPDDQFIAGLSPDGRVVRFGALTKGAVLGSWRPGGHSTSLSWDRHGNLWVATTHGVWLRPPGRKPPIAVDVGLPPGDRVSVLRVAPDGLRVAVIVRGQTSPQILIGAVTRGHNNTASISQLVPIGQGIPDPTALSWYDADNLIVLTNPGTARARLERVPVNGGQPVEVEPEQHIVSLATAGTQAQLVAGLRSGRLVTFAGNAAGWGPLSPGQYPAYPG
jgi:hypothetical protein